MLSGLEKAHLERQYSNCSGCILQNIAGLSGVLLCLNTHVLSYDVFVMMYNLPRTTLRTLQRSRYNWCAFVLPSAAVFYQLPRCCIIYMHCGLAGRKVRPRRVCSVMWKRLPRSVTPVIQVSAFSRGSPGHDDSRNMHTATQPHQQNSPANKDHIGFVQPLLSPHLTGVALARD